MLNVTTGETQPTAIGANDTDLAPGTDVGEYRIGSVLGKGGFGTVYGAVQPVIGKQVAIKVLARKYSADPEVVSRFAAEARAVNQIRHRNIIDIFSFGQLSDGRHYYVMEHLEGDPLDVYLRTHGPMPVDEAIPVLRSIARALDAAHAKGIAHRDLKPENIFLARDADGGVFPKLLDFGIAKLMSPDDDDIRHKTNTGVPIGTPYYMSPEQARGKDVDHRTDIYSFGIVAYRVLTGTYPFDADNYMELLFKQINEEPLPPSARNPDLPASVDEAIAWMMRKDRTQRPPNVIEGVNALDPTAAVTPSVPSRGSRPTVPPRLTITAKKATSTEALAATFTPEFVRPTLSEVLAPTPRKGLLWLIVGALLVLAAIAVVAIVVLGRAQAPTTTPPVQLAPVTAPVTAPVAPQLVIEHPPEVVHVEVAVPPIVEATLKKKRKDGKSVTTTSTPAGSGSAAQQANPDADDPGRPRPGDIPSLGSDAFK